MKRLRALWLVPVIIGGSLATVGSIDLVGAQGTGTLEVCKTANSVPGTWSFTVSGHTGTISVTTGSCSPGITLSSGKHTVTEAPTAGVMVTKITSTPGGLIVSRDKAAGSAVIRVPAGQTTAINFTNEPAKADFKVCKQAASNSPSLVGQGFSFKVNGGSAFTVVAGANGSPNCSNPITGYTAGTVITVAEVAAPSNTFVSDITAVGENNVNADTAAGTVTFTLTSGLHDVVYTNEIKVTAVPGYLKICKDASDSYVAGNFSFSVVDAAGLSYGPFSVLVGQCTDPIQVTAGQATITEAHRAPYFLSSVSTVPSSALGPVNLTNQTAVVTVPASTSTSNEVVADFTNDTNMGLIEICKELTSNSAALTGTTFDFTVSYDLASTTGSTGSVDASVVANAPGQSACTNPSNISLPVGTNVSISETSMPFVALVSSSNTNFTVTSGVNTASFTNEAEGTLEICKSITGPPATFNFLVDGTTPVSVAVNTANGSNCSLPFTVPAGQNTVEELSTPNFHLVSITSNNLVSISGSTATVNVTYPGGIANETVVTFTNAVNTGEFKICKTAVGDTNGFLSTTSFHFTWSYSVNGTTFTGSASLTPGQCTGFIGPIPVLQNNDTPVTVTVQESPTSGFTANGIAWHLQNISYSGNGTFGGGNTSTGIATFTVGAGLQSITYDNEPGFTGTGG